MEFQVTTKAMTALEKLHRTVKVVRTLSRRALLDLVNTFKELEQNKHDVSPVPSQTKEEKSSDSNNKKKKATVDECEFAIAADLTLYANPLRCLMKTAKTPSQRSSEASQAGSEMIAADLVKYGSPLDDKPN